MVQRYVYIQNCLGLGILNMDTILVRIFNLDPILRPDKVTISICFWLDTVYHMTYPLIDQFCNPDDMRSKLVLFLCCLLFCLPLSASLLISLLSQHLLFLLNLFLVFILRVVFSRCSSTNKSPSIPICEQ